MLGHSKPRTINEIDQRLRSIERGLERAGTQAASTAVSATDHVAETVASVLGSLAERFRGLSIGEEAAKFGGDAAKLGNDALRRLSKEVEHRPLVTLAVAAGVGLLVGLILAADFSNADSRQDTKHKRTN
jgi:ElaB/YqjD/DUF883 family membrane-anchored ribosome-binding protein